MLKVYSVTYDLVTKTEPDYEGLYQELRNSYRWWHYLESTWLIQTGESADQVFQRLAPHIHHFDRLLIIEVRDNCQGWLTEEAWDWIHKHVPYHYSAVS